MRKRLALRMAGVSILALVCAPTAAAQLDVGIFMGPTISAMSGSFVGNTSSTLGIGAGLFFERRFGRRWSVEVAVSSVQKGAFDVAPASGGEMVDYKLTYLELPVLVHFLIPVSGKPWVFGVYAGGAVGASTGCLLKPSTNFGFDDECEETTVGGLGKTPSFSVLPGLDFRWVFPGGSRWGLDVRYNLGLENALEGAEQANLTARNNVWQVMFRLVLPLTGGS